MDWLSVIIVLFAALVAVTIHIMVGTWFASVAEIKGYERDAWKSACVLFGMPVWLLVIALPNKTYHKELLAALRDRKSKEC